MDDGSGAALSVTARPLLRDTFVAVSTGRLDKIANSDCGGVMTGGGGVMTAGVEFPPPPQPARKDIARIRIGCKCALSHVCLS